MKYSFFSFFLKQNKSRLRGIIRGREILISRGELDLLVRLKDKISRDENFVTTHYFSKKFFGNQVSNQPRIITQYLLNQIGNLSFNSSILYYFGNQERPLVYPLPLHWSRILEENGITVDRKRSRMLWQVYLLFMYAFGIYTFLYFIYFNLFDLFIYQKSPKKCFVYFNDLNINCIPSYPLVSDNKNIINWYIKKYGGTIDELDLCHSVKKSEVLCYNKINVFYLRSSFISFPHLKNLIVFFLKNIELFIYTFSSYITGRWWNVLFYSEAIKLNYVDIQDKDCIASEYWFHNSQWLYKPLWLYRVEERGAKVVFYFYSTNIASFLNGNPNQIFANTWNLISWSNILVWNNSQKKFIEKFTNSKSVVEVVGPIWFSSNQTDIKTNGEMFIAVFDVQPYRESRYSTLGDPFDYYIPSICNSFLSDIQFVAEKNNIDVKLKRKRDAGNLIHKSYLLELDKLRIKQNFEILNSDLDVYKIINNSSMVISMPFTSTALIAQELGKPTIFYDPSSRLFKDDPAAHGIQVISSVVDLEKWVVSNLRISQLKF